VFVFPTGRSVGPRKPTRRRVRHGRPHTSCRTDRMLIFGQRSDATGRRTLTLDYYEKGQTYDFGDSSSYTPGPSTGEAIGGTASDGRPVQLGVSSGDAASIYGARDSEQVQRMERVGGGPLASSINIYAGRGLDAAIADSRNTNLAPGDAPSPPPLTTPSGLGLPPAPSNPAATAATPFARPTPAPRRRATPCYPALPTGAPASASTVKSQPSRAGCSW
jgi:hypothetical protein